VELLGPPAAGKSTLARWLAGSPGATVLKDHDPLDARALALGLTRSLPVALVHPPDADAARWAAWAGRLSAAPALAARRLRAGYDVVVFDQGPVYTLGRMEALRGRKVGAGWWCDRLVDTAGLLDLLVLVDATTEALAERVVRRGGAHPAAALPRDDLLRYLQQQRLQCHDLADRLSREGTKVLRIGTDEGALPSQATEILVAAGSRSAPAA
jgi:hypothetical protein